MAAANDNTPIHVVCDRTRLDTYVARKGNEVWLVDGDGCQYTTASERVPVEVTDAVVQYIFFVAEGGD